MKIPLLVLSLAIIACETGTLHGSPVPMFATASTSITSLTTTWSKTVSPSSNKVATTKRRKFTTSSSASEGQTTEGTSTLLDVSTYPTANTECHCNNNQSCNTTSLTCVENTSCDPDTQKCSEGCLPGWHGDRCDQECHCNNNQSCNTTSLTCAENTSCDPDTQKCSEGCLPGWHGDRCDKGISSTSTPSNGGSSLLLPRDIAILVLTLLFVASLAINIFVLIRRVRSKHITSGPTKSYDVARYRPEEDGQVNLIRDEYLSTLDYQPSNLVSGLPVETYEFVEPEAVTYDRTSRVPPPASGRRLSRGEEDPVTELEVGQDEQTDVRPNSLRQVEHGAGQMRNVSDVTELGEYSSIQSGAHGPRTFVRDDQLNQQSVQSTQRQEAPLRPPRRSKTAKQTGEEASDSKAGAGESNAAYRRDSAETSGGTMKRRSGTYTAPNDGLAYLDSDYAGTSDEEDEAHEKYQSALKEEGGVIYDDANADIDDDSDPYENEDFMEKLYRQRARKQTAELETSEATVQHYEDDSDPYENDEDIEAYRERARAREAIRRREESTGQPDEEYKDDSDPYENDEDIEAYRERARAREAMRRREESTGQPDEEYKDDSDPYENDEDIEAYRERARAREAMRRREESTGQPDEEYKDDSDPYEDYADMAQMDTQKQKKHRKEETETKSNELGRKYEEDDSGPNENYEDMGEMYKQRTQQRMSDKIGEAEFEPEIKDTSQAYEDEHDIYENEDFMDELEKERIRQKSTKSADEQDINDNSNQEDEDDLYENDDFIEHMARRRAERKLDKKPSTAIDTHTANKFDGYSKVIRRHSEGSNPAPVSSGLSLYGTSERLNTICDEEGDQIHTRGAGLVQGQVEMEEREGQGVQHSDIQDGLSTDYHYDPGAEGNDGSGRDSENEHLNYGEDLSSQPSLSVEQHHQLRETDEANANMERTRDEIQNQGYDFTDEQNEKGTGAGSPERKWGGFNEGLTRPRDLPVIPIPSESIKETRPDFMQLETKNHAIDSDDISSTRDTDVVHFDQVDRSLNSYQMESESPFEENAWPDQRDQESACSPNQTVHDGAWSHSRNNENGWPQSPTSDTENAWPQSPTSEGENAWQQNVFSGTETALPQSPTFDKENIWPQSPTGNKQDFITDTLSRRSKDIGSRQTQFRCSVSESEEDGQSSGTDLNRRARALDTHARSESTVEFASDNEEFDA